jgi:light-harvesting complex I chlorophyll a/b binding protein 5
MNAPDAAKAQAERATAGALANARMTAPRGLASRREERDMWLGAVTVPPAHLDGSMPGDAGFDPLGLGVDPKRLAWYQEAELMHGRWAMAAVVGVVAAEAAGAAPWWSAGGAASYALPANALLAIQFAVMGVLELKRVNGFIATGESGAWSSFPFDPLGLQKDATRVAEVKHGRLGMLAFAGIVAQAVVYRVGPLLALRDHVEDPFGCNLVSNVAHIGQTFEAVASKM